MYGRTVLSAEKSSCAQPSPSLARLQSVVVCRLTAHPLCLLVCVHRSKGDGDYEICPDFILDDWLRQKIAVSS